MANDWRAVSLGELFRVKHGFAFKSEYFTDEPQDTVLVTPGNFAIGGGFQDGKRKYYNGQLPEDYVLKPGQVVVTMTDLSKESDTLGYAASIPNDSTVWLHNQRVGLLEFKTEIPTSPRFIEYLLRTHEYRSWIVGSATGTTVKHTAPGRIENFATRIPPIEEQHAIAHILGTLDDKIELNRKQNETLEAMARTLFKAWFVDFEPVRAKLEGRWQRGQSLPGLPAHLFDLFPDRLVESELGEIPEGWEPSDIGRHFSLTMGQSPPSSTYNESGDGLPFFQGRTDFGFRFPSHRVFCTVPTRLAKVGDTLVSVRAPVGDVNIAIEPCAVGRGVAAVRHFGGSSSFTYHAMHNLGEHFGKFEGEGTVFGSINKADFERLPFVAPTQAVLVCFDRIASPIDDRVEFNEDESRALAQLRDTLLPKLISGELRVPDAEVFLKARE